MFPVRTARICTWVPPGRSPPGSWHTSPSSCACTCTGDLPGRGDTHRDTASHRDRESSAFPAAPSPNPHRAPPAHPALALAQLTVPAEATVVPGTAHGAGGGTDVQEGTVLVAALTCGRRGGTFGTMLTRAKRGGNRSRMGWMRGIGVPWEHPCLAGGDGGPGCVTVALLPAVRRWHQPLARGQARGTREARGGVGRGSVGCPAPHPPNLE